MINSLLLEFFCSIKILILQSLGFEYLPRILEGQEKLFEQRNEIKKRY